MDTRTPFELRERQKHFRLLYERGLDRARGKWLAAKKKADRAEAEVTRDLLLLVGRVGGVNRLMKWSQKQRAAAEKWAAAVHLRASDNLVRVPEEPAHVRALAKAP